MPTYDFSCSACQGIFEVVRSIKDTAPVPCPKCNSGETTRVFLQAPATFSRNNGRTDSPLDSAPEADKLRTAADHTINKVLKDMGLP